MIATFDSFTIVELPDTELVGIIVITSLSDRPPPFHAHDFPAVGEQVRAIVLGHREFNHQIDLSLRESDFERYPLAPPLAP